MSSVLTSLNQASVLGHQRDRDHVLPIDPEPCQPNFPEMERPQLAVVTCSPLDLPQTDVFDSLKRGS